MTNETNGQQPTSICTRHSVLSFFFFKASHKLNTCISSLLLFLPLMFVNFIVHKSSYFGPKNLHSRKTSLYDYIYTTMHNYTRWYLWDIFRIFSFKERAAYFHEFYIICGTSKYSCIYHILNNIKLVKAMCFVSINIYAKWDNLSGL